MPHTHSGKFRVVEEVISAVKEGERFSCALLDFVTGACELNWHMADEQQERVYWHAHGSNQRSDWLVTWLKVYVPNLAGEMEGQERLLQEDR